MGSETKLNLVKALEMEEKVIKVVAKEPTYLTELNESFETWTGIHDDMAKDAIKDLSGNLWQEIRRLEAIICKEIETRGLPEDFKIFFKDSVNQMWKDILGKQKMGMDKLSVIIYKNIKKNDKDNK